MLLLNIGMKTESQVVDFMEIRTLVNLISYLNVMITCMNALTMNTLLTALLNVKKDIQLAMKKIKLMPKISIPLQEEDK